MIAVRDGYSFGGDTRSSYYSDCSLESHLIELHVGHDYLVVVRAHKKRELGKWDVGRDVEFVPAYLPI